MLATDEPIETHLFAQATQQGMGLSLGGQRGSLGVERSKEETTLSDEDSIAAVHTQSPRGAFDWGETDPFRPALLLLEPQITYQAAEIEIPKLDSGSKENGEDYYEGLVTGQQVDELEEILRSRRSSEKVLLAESGAAAVTEERVRWSVDYIALCELEMLTLSFLDYRGSLERASSSLHPSPIDPTRTRRLSTMMWVPHPS